MLDRTVTIINDDMSCVNEMLFITENYEDVIYFFNNQLIRLSELNNSKLEWTYFSTIVWSYIIASACFMQG